MRKKLYKVETPSNNFTMALTDRDAKLIRWFLYVGNLDDNYDNEDPFVTMTEVDTDNIVEFDG